MVAAAILKKISHNYRIYWPIAFNFCQYNTIQSSSARLKLKIRLVKSKMAATVILKNKLLSQQPYLLADRVQLLSVELYSLW